MTGDDTRTSAAALAAQSRRVTATMNEHGVAFYSLQQNGAAENGPEHRHRQDVFAHDSRITQKSHICADNAAGAQGYLLARAFGVTDRLTNRERARHCGTVGNEVLLV